MYNPQLKTFIRVADAGSFNKAADEAFITPTAIIKQINLLEADLDVKLFERTHRGLILTDAGKSFYKDAKFIIQYSKDSLVRTREIAHTYENIIRIGSSHMTPGQFIVELWPRIHEYCPNIKFQLVPFENTPELAKKILKNLGENIDIVAGMYDSVALSNWKCNALQLSNVPIRVAVSLNHPLASKTRLTIQDLYGQNFMIIRRGWNKGIDILRDDMLHNHPKINVVDFEFYDLNVFNQCENSHDILLAIDYWKDVHPLLKILPVEWNYEIPFGILHSPTPTKPVRQLLEAVQKIKEKKI